MNDSIGFIGLGKLGLPVATNLVDAGYALRVYNRTASKAGSLVARGARLFDRPAGVATSGGVVVSVLWDDAALEGVVESEGFLEQLGAGVHVSMSTALPETAKRLAELHAARGSTYVEAPIFGRPAAAVARKLLIPIAGPEAAKSRVMPLLTAMGGERIFDFGEAIGAATVVKLVGNFLIVSAARSMIEALSMADKSGVDVKAVVDMLTTTLFAAPIYRSYGKMIADKTLPVSQISSKDIGLFRRTAADVGSETPIAGRLHEMLLDVRRAV